MSPPGPRLAASPCDSHFGCGRRLRPAGIVSADCGDFFEPQGLCHKPITASAFVGRGNCKWLARAASFGLLLAAHKPMLVRVWPADSERCGRSGPAHGRVRGCGWGRQKGKRGIEATPIRKMKGRHEDGLSAFSFWVANLDRLTTSLAIAPSPFKVVLDLEAGDDWPG
jgi:hypothetical protein